MYITERFVFVELHKTGGTHIGKWLSRLTPGEQLGKHNRVPPELRNRSVIGSVRNPWDWYVSLWSYGCGGHGSVFRQVTGGLDVNYLVRQLGREMGRLDHPIKAMARQAISDLRRPAAKWRSVYQDPHDPTAFRTWLSLMMDPARRFDLKEGYGFSPVSSWAGILTYRYLKLFSTLDGALYEDARLDTMEGARDRWRATRLVQSVIRTEHLEEDLIEALAATGYTLTDEQQAAVRSGRSDKTNTSQRRLAAHYYDEASVALVGAREALLIEEHGYRPPTGEA